MRYFYLISLLFHINTGFCQILSPTVITTAGDEYSNSYAKMSVTIGEPVTETVTNNGTTLTQGFQQGVYYVVNVEENIISGINTNIYPNPVTNIMNIEITGVKENVLLTLVDANGKYLLNENYESNELIHTIDFSKYSTGSYFIKIALEKSGYFKTVKIVKANK